LHSEPTLKNIQTTIILSMLVGHLYMQTVRKTLLKKVEKYWKNIIERFQKF